MPPSGGVKNQLFWGRKRIGILPGQYFDEETNLHYNWQRYYSPETGRYLQVDPYGFYAQDENLYRYAFGNATNLADPRGEFVNFVAAAAAGAAFDAGWQVAENLMTGQEWSCGVGKAALRGAVSGLIGFGIGKVATKAYDAYKLSKLAKEGRLASQAIDELVISTGRTTPNNLKEKLAMEEVMSNPRGTTPPRMPKMSDNKNGLLAEDGWVKRTQNVNGVEIHYVENVNTRKVVDFKFKD